MVVPLVLLLLAAAPCPTDVPRLRGASPREAAIIQDLLARSATARALASVIESLDVIVYVETSYRFPAGRAATRLVAATPVVRFFRVTLGPARHPDDLASLLAHELQHVTEMARLPDVRDARDVQRLYRRIGEDPLATSTFETAAAREIGWRVREELSRDQVGQKRSSDHDKGRSAGG
jgi:hypothetical protein